MSDLVFDFVQSLTLREKAYFRRYAQLYSDSKEKNYLKIYDFLEKQRSYDEQALKATFRDEKFVKYLSSEKHYLLEQILNSLINFHANTSINRKLQKLILYINILSEKGFKKKANKILRQAKTLALKYEEFTVVLQLIQMEEEILFSHGILDYVQQLETLKKEREAITQKIQELNELRLLKAQARELQYKFLPHVSQTVHYPHIFNHPLLKNLEHIQSLKAKEVWHYINSILYYLVRDYEESLKGHINYLQFYESHEFLFQKNQKLPILSNYIYLAAKTKNGTHFFQGLTKLEQLLDEKVIDAAYIYYIKYARILEFYHKTQDAAATASVLPEISSYIEKNTDKFGKTEIDHIICQMIRAGIETKQHTNAQQWINLWYDTVSIEVNLNLVKLYSIIIYYELGYLNLLEHEISSTYKTLKNRRRLKKLERSFIRFCKKIIKDFTHSKHLKALTILQSDLEEIKKDPLQNTNFEDFDFLQWTVNKIQALKSKKEFS